MSLSWTGHFGSLDTSTLSDLFDYVSPDVDGAAITIGATSGRDGRGGLEFVAGSDSDTFAYGQYVQQVITVAQTQTFGFAINQTLNQGALGGRLLTLVDGAVDVFGETVQVAINIMPDSTLQATRANAQGTGIILRGIDQGVDAQMTLLGNSTDVLVNGAYLEITVFHHPTAGSVSVNFYDLTHTLTSNWMLVNVNTAISGVNQSSSFCYGGYAATDLSFSQRYHEDLVAILSDVYVLNGLTNPDDSRDPTSALGDTAFILTLQTNNSVSEWTPDPVQANYLNVTEIPPDAGATENTTFTVDNQDSGELAAVTGSTEEVKLAYSAVIKNDSSDTCLSGNPSDFEAMIYMEQPDAGTCETSAPTGPPCNLSDRIAHRAQTVCTISQNGESVTFKPNATAEFLDGYVVFLTPLDAPPPLWQLADPGAVGPLYLNSRNRNMTITQGEASYNLPFYQPWAGYAYSDDPSTGLMTTGDYIEFKVNTGSSLDVGFIDHAYDLTFDPYSPVEAAFHFRIDNPTSPYFYCGVNFSQSTEPSLPYADFDVFKLIRNATNYTLYQNGVLVETITPSVMPVHDYPYILAGRWGFTPSGTYNVRPGIYDATCQRGGSNCLTSFFGYNCVRYGDAGAPVFIWDESKEWGVSFYEWNSTRLAQVFDATILYDVPDILFEFDDTTICRFVLNSGNVVLEVENWVGSMPAEFSVVGSVASYTYTRPFSQTDDFLWWPQPWWPITYFYRTGYPTFPFINLQYDFINNTDHQMTPNAPLRLGIIVDDDSAYALPDKAGINNVSFTFVPDAGSGPMSYAGQMTENTVERAGTETLAPADYHYKQSFLASTPADTAITVDDVNDSTHGYERSS